MLLVTLVSFSILSDIGKSDNIFHESSKMMFVPDISSDYFGYSVLLDSSGLLVGAPKARSRVKPSITPGLIFRCPLSNLEPKNVKCDPVMLNRGFYRTELFDNNTWIGASIATINSETLLMCSPYTKYQGHLGACAAQRDVKGPARILDPFDVKSRQFYYINATARRPNYGDNGNKLKFYINSLFGMSTKVINNSSLIIGAPGLLERTGGVVEYEYRPNSKKPDFRERVIANPYFTDELEYDDYFGYSIESGIFDDSQNILFVAGAPRSKSGYGQVLIFEPAKIEKESLHVKAAITGPHLGSYFGAAICCTDINGDGRTDVLVGAPNFIRNERELSFDEGAVFVYLTRKNGSSFILEKSNYVTGSGVSAARFGTTIADLGDLDGDGFTEIAVGAPWENNGSGVVYIYSCNDRGLISPYTQRIVAKRAKSFGLAISRGLDLDNNKCNDFAVGAFKTESVYVYRCIPTVKVAASVTVPDIKYLTQNATSFNASFCVDVSSHPRWTGLKTDWNAVITLDSTEIRARVLGKNNYTLTIYSGNKTCALRVIEIINNTDLSMPIQIEFDVESVSMAKDTITFPTNAVRLSRDTVLHSSIDIQLTKNCGEDLICTPWFELTLKAWLASFIPGTNDTIGFNITVTNKAEPAYGVTVNITLPVLPKRLPSSCRLQNKNLTCMVPPGFTRDIVWGIELEKPSSESNLTELRIKAFLEDLYGRNISDGFVKEVVTTVTPKATFVLKGRSMPNTSLQVEREKQDNVSFSHYFEITNYGPSNWKSLKVHIRLPQEVVLLNKSKDCSEKKKYMECLWTISAKSTMAKNFNYRFDLNVNVWIF